MIERLSRNELVERVRQHAAVLDLSDNPFASAAWLGNYLQHVAATVDHQYLCAHVDGRALMLLQSDARTPSQARALNNYYSSLFTPFAGHRTEGDAERVVQELSATNPALATVDLSPLSEDDAGLVELAFKARGWLTRPYACFGNWHLPCEGLMFDDFMSTRPWRRTVTNWARKEKNSKTGPIIRLEVFTDPTDLARAMSAYEHVYSKSWKRPEPFPGFVPGWAAECAARGWLRLGVAWSEDTPIASQFWFTAQRRAYIYKLAYDEAYAKLSAGTILSAHMFRHALEVDRVIEIDYLTGDDAYKRTWMSHRRQRVGVIACNPRTFRGAMRAAYEWAGATRHRLWPNAPAKGHTAGTETPT